MVQMFSMVGQDPVHGADAGFNRHVTQSEQNDTGMGQPVAKHKIAEVFVVCQDDTLGTKSDREYFPIG